jgi:hypothetical protein
MPTRAQLAVIHIAVKELHLTDEVYRDILWLRFRKESACDLTPEEVSALLDHFKSLGWKPRVRQGQEQEMLDRRREFDALGLRPGMATPAQLRKIVVDWMTGHGIHVKTRTALRHFLQHRFHASDLRFVKADQVGAILGAIRHMGGVRLRPDKLPEFSFSIRDN